MVKVLVAGFKGRMGNTTVQMVLEHEDFELVERARLEIVYTPQGYRGFESLLLRQIRTVILIQSVSGLRFLLFGKNGVFAALLHPAAPKENPARLFSWSGFCLCVGFVVLVIVERA